jgi:hypothetical protein
MADFAYALHTDVCTYLLDEAGVCLWVLSPNPATAALVEACVGAQFVACSDPRVEGGLSGELLEGASALFVTMSSETGRPILLRTGPIRRVQFRTPGDTMLDQPLERPRPKPDMIADEDLVEPATVRAGAPKAARKKGETHRPPPMLRSAESQPKAGPPPLPRNPEAKAGPPPLPKSAETGKAGPPPLPKTAEPSPHSTTKPGPPPLPKSAEAQRPPPVKTTRRKNDPEDSSITIETYPGTPMRNRLGTLPGPPTRLKPAEDAAPLPLRNKKKKT